MHNLAPPSYRVAVGQTPSVADVATNVESVVAFACDAAKEGAKLMVFPECGLTGYVYDSLEETRNAALARDGSELTELAHAAQELDMVLVVGYLEHVGDEVFNTATLLGPGGVRGDYRKTHIPYLAADRFVTPGTQGPVVVETNLGAIGLSICYDLRFPEWSRALALAGADIIANPTNWAITALPWAKILPPARAFENGVYVLAANRGDAESGVDYIGLSSISTPDGDVVEVAERGTSVLLADVDLSQVRKPRFVGTPGESPYFAGRRPELYRGLVEGRG